MKLNVKEYLTDFIQTNSDIEHKEFIRVPDAVVETNDIRMIMISEVVPKNPDDYFYSKHSDSAFVYTIISIFD